MPEIKLDVNDLAILGHPQNMSIKISRDDGRSGFTAYGADFPEAIQNLNAEIQTCRDTYKVWLDFL